MIYEEMDVRAEPISKNFSDNLKDDVEEANSPKLNNQRSTFVLRDEGHQGIVKTPKIHNSGVKLTE